MRKFTPAVIDKITAGKTFSNSANERYLYLTITVAVVFAGIMHIFLLFAMMLLGVNLLVFLNCISVLIYISLLLMVTMRRMYRTVGIVTTFEVIFHALFASYYLGINCYFFLYFFLLLLIQLNIPYEKVSIRIVTSAATFIALIWSVAIGYSVEPIYQFQNQSALVALSVSNCILCFGGTLIELLAINIIRSDNAERVRKYKERAHTDSLTGIYNRWYAEGFIANFSKEKEESNWCIAIIDVDDFKNVNDTMGHLAGDEVLRTLAGIDRKSTRLNSSH